jgi:hypothetical protein
VARQARAHDAEVRRVQRRQLHNRDAHVAALVQELAAQRLGEALDRVLGGAVRRLQRDRAVGERRPDLDDHAAVARAHPPQRRERSVHVAEIGDLGHPADFVGA